MIAGSYKGDRPINITGNAKVLSKADCNQSSIANGVREQVSYSFALPLQLVRKIYKDPRIKNFKKTNKSVMSHITIFLEDDDHKPVDFSGETISFTCHIIKL